VEEYIRLGWYRVPQWMRITAIVLLVCTALFMASFWHAYWGTLNILPNDPLDGAAIWFLSTVGLAAVFVGTWALLAAYATYRVNITIQRAGPITRRDALIERKSGTAVFIDPSYYSIGAVEERPTMQGCPKCGGQLHDIYFDVRGRMYLFAPTCCIACSNRASQEQNRGPEQTHG